MDQTQHTTPQQDRLLDIEDASIAAFCLTGEEFFRGDLRRRDAWIVAGVLRQGICLTLARRLVEMQGGKIEAHSAKDPLNLGLQSTMWLREAACQAFQLSNPLLGFGKAVWTLSESSFGPTL